MSSTIEEFNKQNPKDWKARVDSLFPLAVPFRARWEDQASIIAVLNHLGSQRNVCHLFFARGGGLDLSGASASTEDGLVELHFGESRRVCKIANLTFEAFGDPEDYQWAYFRIETEPLEPTGVAGNTAEDLQEELVELAPGWYAPRSAWDEREYRGAPLPDGARLITRLMSGSMVVFQKSSFYNWAPAAYMAPHNGLSSDELRQQIERVRERNQHFVAPSN